MEMERAKHKAQQIKEGPFALSMNAMVETIKVLQTLVVSKRETNMQLSLELREAQKEKGARSRKEASKAMKTQMSDPFM
jgi:FtsZ-binding cell division protein ZapB